MTSEPVTPVLPHTSAASDDNSASGRWSPGWYPVDADRLGWWDGNVWTGQFAPIRSPQLERPATLSMRRLAIGALVAVGLLIMVMLGLGQIVGVVVTGLMLATRVRSGSLSRGNLGTLFRRRPW